MRRTEWDESGSSVRMIHGAAAASAAAAAASQISVRRKFCCG